jgi:undecaprenyl-diphosphatase
MNPIHAIILGAVQGVAEFIPISSSAHLAIVHKLLGESSNNLFFDVMLHLGTLVALVAYFWRDWYDMFKAKFDMSSGKEVGPEREALGNLLGPVIYACIPGTIMGALVGDKLEDHFDSHPLAIALMMAIMGVVLLIADRNGNKGRSLRKITAKDWLSIGISQAFAVIPGVSRSGVTITAGLFSGLNREASARFSFLLGTPIIFGAAAYEIVKKGHELRPDGMGSMFLGMATAAIIGYLCIGFLLEYLKKRSVRIFVVYRILFAVAVVALLKAHALG